MQKSKQNQEQQAFSTPMMRQYQEIKQQHQDCLLFFRLGDFYELFLEDAKIGAQVLNITLTRRPRGKDGDIPMAGVPFHAADTYIAKLIKAGFKVAICEQVSEPNNRGIVEREVIRIITPGTVLDEKTLEKKEHNYVMSLSLGRDSLGLAVADVSTGDFQAAQISYKDNLPQVLSTELARFCPAECLMNQTLYDDPSFLKILRVQKDLNISCFSCFDEHAEQAQKNLSAHFKITHLDSFGLQDKVEAQKAAASLLGYLKHTQKDQVDHIQTIRTYSPEQYVILDRSTITNLELFSTIRQQDQHGSFVQVLDQTVTAMGGRLMRDWIRKPLCQKSTIDQRLNAVEELLEDQPLREDLRETLKQISDIPRLLSRLSVGIGNPYDLVNLKLALRTALQIKYRLEKIQSALLKSLEKDISLNLKELITLIDNMIVDDPPIDTKSGGIIQKGVHSQLDKLRLQMGGDKDWIAQLEKKEKQRTGISSLKIKFNQIFGYYIEISKANLSHAPENYLRKQTMVNAERFITPELKEYEEKILTAQQTINELELSLFLETVSQVLSYTPTLQQLSQSLATIDCLSGLATLALQNNYTKPRLLENGPIKIIEGRHPVVEKLCEQSFVPNDVLLDQAQHQLLILTGPNMAGKSVFMRQVALITLMAHLGSYVPAKEAEISLVDRIFVRSGASDVIASGLSTFMVEMMETAHILNHASAKSLVIMDEIGRGTSTYDGISIAWAVAQYLVTNPLLGAKTLFATHYHELQMLEDKYPEHIRNFNVMVQQKKDGEPIFLHKVMPGRASHSYAIAVAKLAGVPTKVTQNAQQILQKLEKSSLDSGANQTLAFSPDSHSANQLLQEIHNLNLHTLTPLEALNFLAKIQKENLD